MKNISYKVLLLNEGYGFIDVLGLYDYCVLFHVRLSKHDSPYMKHIMHTRTKHKGISIRLCMKKLFWEKD